MLPCHRHVPHNAQPGPACNTPCMEARPQPACQYDRVTHGMLCSLVTCFALARLNDDNRVLSIKQYGCGCQNVNKPWSLMLWFLGGQMLVHDCEQCPACKRRCRHNVVNHAWSHSDVSRCTPPKRTSSWPTHQRSCLSQLSLALGAAVLVAFPSPGAPLPHSHNPASFWSANTPTPSKDGQRSLVPL